MTKHLYFLWIFLLLIMRSSLNVGLPTHQDLAVSRHAVGHAGIRPRSEIDLTTEKQVLFCAGQNRSLECVSPGSTIAIMDTFWGRLTDKICPSEDGDPSTNCGPDSSTTPLLKNLCDDKVFCEIPARHTVLQASGTTHCPGVNKYLIVNYTCMPVERMFVLCDGETTSLKCGEGWKLNILSAMWGRLSPATCATTLGRPSRLGRCDSSNSTLEKVRSICQGRNGCVVRADDQHMIEGNEKHCPDVDKYAMISYRCHPRDEQENILQSSKKGSLTSEQGIVPNNPFINHKSESKDYHANSSRPHLLQFTTLKKSSKKNNKKIKKDDKPGFSLDGLLKAYMDSQNGGGDDEDGDDDNDTSEEVTNAPHDASSSPHKDKLRVPQDGSKGGLQQNIALLKNILQSKNVMKMRAEALQGIDRATAVRSAPESMVDNPNIHQDQNNNEPPRVLELTRDELEHLAQSPDAIKIINEYMNKYNHKQETPLSKFQQPKHDTQQAMNDSSLGRKVNDNEKSEQLTKTATPTTQRPSPTISTTVKTNRKDLNKLGSPTAKLGGKVMGNMFYDKFLKPTQEKTEKQAKIHDLNPEENVINLMRKKISALQTISDALTLITSKLDPHEVGGKRHNPARNNNKNEVGNGFLEVPESVGAKDVQFLQDKINKAIETTEAMERQATLKYPRLVAVKVKGKVAQDVQAATRDTVKQSKEAQKIDKQIKGIEDSFNMLIEKAEKSGKFSDVDIDNKPTGSLIDDLQSGALKMPFNDEQTQGRQKDNSTKGIYGFEVESQVPEINIIKEKGNTNRYKTLEAFKPFSSTSNGPLRKSSSTNISKKAAEQSKVIKLPPHIASKAANSIVNALKRQANERNVYTLALKPITTFNDVEGATLGGRINSEFTKEKERGKPYQGKDINAILKMIKSPPTKPTFAPKARKKGGDFGKGVQVPEKGLEVPGRDVQVPEKGLDVPGRDVQVPGKGLEVPVNDLQVSSQVLQTSNKDKGKHFGEVHNVGKLDENSVKLLSMLVKGFLTHNHEEAQHQKHHRHKKKKQNKEPVDFEDEDFIIGAKHDEMLRSMDSQTNPDSDLLDMLEKQLTPTQNYDHKIDNLVSDGKENEGVDDDTVKSVPNDKKNDNMEDDSLIIFPTMKPSDHSSSELVTKYTEGTNIDRLLLSLQKMLKQVKKEVESNKKVATSSAQVSNAESALKNSLQSKPYVVEFSGASTSGKIINSLDEGQAINSEAIQGIKEFAGGRILKPADTNGIKPVSQETISMISANPTAKPKVGATQEKKPTSKFKLKNLVSGVKRLLKALREKNSKSHMGRHKGKVGKDDNQNDTENMPTEKGESEIDSNANTLKENEKQTVSKHKGTRSWYVGEPKDYRYDEDYDMNLAHQFISNPNEYSDLNIDTFPSPYRDFALQPSNIYGYLPKPVFQDPFDKPYLNKLSIPAKHALNSALRNDPIIQAVEEFSDKERQLYNEKLRGIQKNKIPGKDSIHLTFNKI